MTTDDAILADFWVEVESDSPDASQIVNGKWYAPKFGCDSLEMTLEAIRSQSEADGARKERERVMKIIGEDEPIIEFGVTIVTDREKIRNDFRATLRHAVEKGEK